jgi:hypothetical protein
MIHTKARAARLMDQPQERPLLRALHFEGVETVDAVTGVPSPDAVGEAARPGGAGDRLDEGQGKLLRRSGFSAPRSAFRIGTG